MSDREGATAFVNRALGRSSERFLHYIPKVSQVEANMDWVTLGPALYGEPYGSMDDADN